MAITYQSDIITPEVYLGYMKEEFPERNLFVRSGILETPPQEVQSQLNAGGRLINMPFWDYLSRTAPDIVSDDDTVEITPRKVTASKDQAVKHYWAKAYSHMDIAGIMASGHRKDPAGHVLQHLAEDWMGAEQTMLIASCQGLFADNAANDDSDMIFSVYQDIASPTAANRFSRSAFDRACQTMGDRLGDVVAIAMHSSVFLSVQDNDDIDYVQDSKLEKDIPYYKGRLVIIDDQMPVTSGTNSDKYTCYLFGRGAFAYASASLDADQALEYDRSPLKGNGGGQTNMVTRRHCVLHPRGVKWTDASCSGISPTESELVLATNWDRVYDRKNIKLAQLDVNAG
ncbi:hypothetical protein K1W69_25035 [Hoeflea sp. WL0058]|uniref:Coat protein n=1 Tax=Flavimaribacter sediminis TaxID=2865987 RepID=A0AAE2ZQX7_9HYPH|nr:major capsid protein [Flavimaribacter sediminis]MBW8640481.1 hypothetical protein [Flavimaribacter sediminis]